MDKTIIEKVQGYGFDVYMRNADDTWLLFTDGKRIGYLQCERFGFTLCTVHKPNENTGTGFQVARHAGDFDKAALESCFASVPPWTSSEDRDSVRKWRDMDEYRAANSFNGGYQLVS